MYIKKLLKIANSEAWRVFIWGWIKVVLFKKHFNTQKYKDISFVFPDPLVFLWQFKEIYIDECYDMSIEAGEGILIDCGANVGLCSVYWARKFSNAKIFAIEADPKVAKILQENLNINNIKNVTILNKAAWLYDGEIDFQIGPIDGGTICSDSSSCSTKVPCFNFSVWLNQFQEINYLKVDIEGAEVEVIESIKPEAFKKIKHIFVEYHQCKIEKSEIGKIIWSLEQNGFSCFVSKVIMAPKNLKVNSSDKNTKCFLSQSNIHCIRN